MGVTYKLLGKQWRRNNIGEPWPDGHVFGELEDTYFGEIQYLMIHQAPHWVVEYFFGVFRDQDPVMTCEGHQKANVLLFKFGLHEL